VMVQVHTKDYKRITQQVSNVVDDGYKINVSTSARFKVLSPRLTYNLLLILLLLFSCAEKPKEKIYKETRAAIYTIVEITAVADSETKAKKAIDAAFDEMERLGKLLNFYDENSEVSLINKNAGKEPVSVSSETFEIIEKTLFVSKNTDGGFDITVGPLVRLWDFKNQLMPDDKTIREKQKNIGYGNIILDKKNNTVFLKNKNMQIDPGGIIKGYIADKASWVLKRHGIMAGIVSAAGDIKAFGARPDGKPWKVGIRNPRRTGKDDEIMAAVDLSDMAISTSGDYERFFIKDGIRYHHILDPKTGRPAKGAQSVTIITKEAALTDAFATGIFVQGPKKGMETLKRLGLDGVIVDNDGNILITDGLKDKIEFLKKK
jgi:thiamine biosynthesis lipoprotein